MQRDTILAMIVAAGIGITVGWVASPRAPAITMHKHSHDLKPCKSETECKIKIKVDCDDHTHPTPTTCDTYADGAEVARVGSGTTQLTFTVITGTYKFNQTDGIQFTDLSSSGGGSASPFHCTPDSSDKQKYGCTVSGITPNLYKYSVHVDTFDRVDPWIVNY